MTHNILFADEAVKDINKLDTVIRKRIGKKLDYFMSLSDPLSTAERLTYSKIGSHRWRIGDYRVTFDIEEQNIVVLRVRHRREVYRAY